MASNWVQNDEFGLKLGPINWNAASDTSEALLGYTAFILFKKGQHATLGLAPSVIPAVIPVSLVSGEGEGRLCPIGDCI